LDADFPPCANYQRPAIFLTVRSLLCAPIYGLRRLGRSPYTHPPAGGTSRVPASVNNRVPSWQSRSDFSRRRDKVKSSTFCFLIVSVLLTDRCSRTYHLEVIQHPEVSAEFGSAVLSRLPLAPPLVAQLIVRDSRGNVIES
jgi:hypothetical protein